MIYINGKKQERKKKDTRMHIALTDKFFIKKLKEAQKTQDITYERILMQYIKFPKNNKESLSAAFDKFVRIFSEICPTKKEKYIFLKALIVDQISLDEDWMKETGYHEKLKNL